MHKPFQRKGAKSNTHVGKEFERKAREFFSKQGLNLQNDVSIQVGVNGTIDLFLYLVPGQIPGKCELRDVIHSLLPPSRLPII